MHTVNRRNRIHRNLTTECFHLFVFLISMRKTVKADLSRTQYYSTTLIIANLGMRYLLSAVRLSSYCTMHAGRQLQNTFPFIPHSDVISFNSLHVHQRVNLRYLDAASVLRERDFCMHTTGLFIFISVVTARLSVRFSIVARFCRHVTE